MPALTFFHSFKEKLAEGVHNLASDQLRLALVNNASGVDQTLDNVLADITQIAYTNLLNNPTSRAITVTSSGMDGTTYRLVLQDMTLEASGGALPAFRYVVLYNDTAASDDLIGYVDYGSDLTLAEGEQLTIDFNPTTGALSLATA